MPLRPIVDEDLAWPIDGMAFVIAFAGPLSAGPIIGALAHDWRAFVFGIFAGVVLTLGNGWASSRFLDPLIAKFRTPLLKPIPRIIANVVVFTWGIILCALSMLAPIIVLGTEILASLQ